LGHFLLLKVKVKFGTHGQVVGTLFIIKGQGQIWDTWTGLLKIKVKFGTHGQVVVTWFIIEGQGQIWDTWTGSWGMVYY